METPKTYNDSQIATLALTLISGLGAVMVKQLVAYTGSPESVFLSQKRVLSKIPGVGPAMIQNLLAEGDSALKQAREEIEKLEKQGGRMWTYLDKDFPQRLKSVNDCPPVLFGKGNFDFENPRILAVVGTRQATQYGKSAIEEFFADLKAYHPVIVSGLAYGIDISAHKVALNQGIETWGVMATGIDSIYPAQHKSTAIQIQNHGGILTENRIGTNPDAPRFPARNRIIAALADAVWVVEAMEKGGALITARLAQEYFRDVFALPGNIHQKTSLGCNRLIEQNQAGLALSGQQLAESLGWKLPGDKSENKTSKSRLRLNLNPEDQKILELFDLSNQSLHMDEIAWKTQIPIYELASQLLNLEFQGLVKSLPGKRFSAMP